MEKHNWYLNYYACDCGCEWTDAWDCACDDEYPECGADCSPHYSEEIEEE